MKSGGGTRRRRPAFARSAACTPGAGCTETTARQSRSGPWTGTRHGVQLTPDGIHLIRPGPWAWLREDKTPDLDVEAVTFFANGRLLRTYRVGELVDDPGRVERSVSHYRWEQEGRVSGDFEYTITTLDGNRFVFDVRTGEIASASRVARVSRWGWWVTLGVVALAAAVWFVWRRRSRLRRIEAEAAEPGYPYPHSPGGSP